MFNEMWFNEYSQQKLAELAKTVYNLEGSYIEVGSWEGRSTVALANAVYPQDVHAVDWWKGSKPDGYYYEPDLRDVFATFQQNIEELTQLNVCAYRMRWQEFAKTWDRPIKFIFIDAEHTYRAVYDNITWARTLLVPGGIICGDDYGHPPVREAVTDHFGPVNTDGVWNWRNNEA